jgi:hypothetical protein
MKLHPSLITKLIEVYTVNSGWTGEKKLNEALANLDFTIYTQQDGTQVLVDTEQYQRAMTDALAQKQPNAYTGR